VTHDPRTVNPYAYCNDNPTNHTDSLGLYDVWDDVLFAGVGAVTGTAALAVHDLFAGKVSSGSAYAGAFVGGGVAGEVMLYTFNPVASGEALTAISPSLAGLGPAVSSISPVLAGTAGASTANIVKQGINSAVNGDEFDSQDFANDVFNGAYFGAVAGSSGNLASPALALRLTTNLANGNWENFSLSTAASVASFLGISSIPDLVGSGVEGAASTSFGGVNLNATATLLGNVQDFGGATYDQATGQIILYGLNNQNTLLPPMDLDDLSVAVDSEYGLNTTAADPGVSIGTVASTVSGQMYVSYFGAVMDTGFGETLFNSDRLLKSLTLGKDNVTGTPISSTGLTSYVPGYKDMLDRYKAGGAAGIAAVKSNPTERFWFTPQLVTLAPSSAGDAFEFSTAVGSLQGNMFMGMIE
jgi:hypothetical protein